MNKEKLINTLIGIVSIPVILVLVYCTVEAIKLIGAYLFMICWFIFSL